MIWVKKSADIMKERKSVDLEAEIPLSVLVTKTSKEHLKPQNEKTDKLEENIEGLQDSCPVVIERNKLCHFCLCYGKNIESLFSKSGREGVLVEMLRSLMSIALTSETEVPSRICESCKTEIIKFNEFRNKCVKSIHAIQSAFELPLLELRECMCKGVRTVRKKSLELQTRTLKPAEVSKEHRPEVQHETDATELKTQDS
ncbi:unnamed protein product, partial [Leptidea sinapis]